MKILVYECNSGTNIKESKLEEWLDKYEIVIIEKIGAGANSKKDESKSPMSDVIIKDSNTAFAVHHLLKESKKYYISGGIQKEDGKWTLQVPMSTKEIAEKFRNTIEYKQ